MNKFFKHQTNVLTKHHLMFLPNSIFLTLLKSCIEPYKEGARALVCRHEWRERVSPEKTSEVLWLLWKQRTCVPRHRWKSPRKWTPDMLLRPCTSLTLWELPRPFPVTATRVASTTPSTGASSKSITSNVDGFHAPLWPNHPSVWVFSVFSNSYFVIE